MGSTLLPISVKWVEERAVSLPVAVRLVLTAPTRPFSHSCDMGTGAPTGNATRPAKGTCMINGMTVDYAHYRHNPPLRARPNWAGNETNINRPRPKTVGRRRSGPGKRVAVIKRVHQGSLVFQLWQVFDSKRNNPSKSPLFF